MWVNNAALDAFRLQLDGTALQQYYNNKKILFAERSCSAKGGSSD